MELRKYLSDVLGRGRRGDPRCDEALRDYREVLRQHTSHFRTF